MSMPRPKNTSYAPIARLTEKERKQQTQLIMKLFELWNLTDKEKAIALGLSPHTQTSIYKYKTGKQDLPINTDTQDRISHLLAIHRCLRRAYPFNKELAYLWIKTPNTDFDNQSPFDIIHQEHFLGLYRIRKYLEIHEHPQDYEAQPARPFSSSVSYHDHFLPKKSQSR